MPSTTVQSEQTSQLQAKNFLDRDDLSIFSERVCQASKSERLRTTPLLACIDRTYRISAGMGTILRIANANRLHEDAPCSDEPPLSPSTVYTLLDIGQILSDMLVKDIETISEWADNHGILDDVVRGNG